MDKTSFQGLSRPSILRWVPAPEEWLCAHVGGGAGVRLSLRSPGVRQVLAGQGHCKRLPGEGDGGWGWKQLCGCWLGSQDTRAQSRLPQGQ